MFINVVYGASVNNAPSGFTTGIANAVQFLDNTFSNIQVTLNIGVDFGVVNNGNGNFTTVGGLGASQWNGFAPAFSYDQLRSALIDLGAPGAGTLENFDPTGGRTLQMSRAEAKALGLLVDNSGTLDGWSGFSSSYTFDYNRSDGITSGAYDFMGTAIHEFTEIMGRLSLLGSNGNDDPNDYTPMDLFRYNLPGDRQFGTGDNSYFSLDNGQSAQLYWNNFASGNNGDLGDWAPADPFGNPTGNDSFLDNSNPGVQNDFSNADLLLMQAMGWYAPPVPPPPPMVDPPVGTTGDFNGDGKSDIVWRRASDGQTVLWEMNAGKKLADVNLNKISTDWHIQGFGDFNGDGNSDIVWRNDNGTTVLWEMNGGKKLLDVNLNKITTDWTIQGIGDFNGDGKSDLLWRRAGDGQTVLWEMNGGNKLLDVNLNKISTDWHIEGIGDLNGDGRSDILWRNANGQTVLWEMNGGKKLLDATLPSISADWHVQAVGDFNGDGKADILWRNSQGAILLWEMNGGQKLLEASLGTIGTHWHIVATGDYNGDGKRDIVWRSDQDGTTVLWEMNGATKLADVNLNAIPLEWAVQTHHYDFV